MAFPGYVAIQKDFIIRQTNIYVSPSGSCIVPFFISLDLWASLLGE